MFLKLDFNLIVTIVNRGFSDPVIKAAKTEGADGATILTARGAGIHETDTFMGVSIQPEKEVILILVKKSIRKKVMRAICKSSGLTDEGKGMCFSMPVDEIGGIIHLLSFDKKKTTKKVVDKNVGVKDKQPIAKSSIKSSTSIKDITKEEKILPEKNKTTKIIDKAETKAVEKDSESKKDN